MDQAVEAVVAVVEDDDEIRRLVVGLLTREGYQVEQAETGADLDAILARTAPDIVILDLMLPGEDGLSICRRLRGRGGAVPILMLTAKSDAIDRVVGLEMGADDISPSRSIRANSSPACARSCGACAAWARRAQAAALPSRDWSLISMPEA